MKEELLRKYLSGNASAEEKKQVMEWVKLDEANKTELLALRKLYDITLWQTGENKKRTQNTNAILYRVASIAAIFLLVFGSGFYIIHLRRQLSNTVMQTLHVPAGQRAELILADGTSVWLNAGSTFTFPNNFSSDKREVSLDGEGFFQVKSNEKKPFIVNTSSYKIKVLGTEFNVMAYQKSSFFEVALLSGLVEVSSDVTNEKTQFQPNQRVYVENDRLQVGDIMHLDHLLWKNGIISFDDEPVETMIGKLELYFDTKIIIQNDSFKKRRYTGKFWTKDGIEHILKVFKLKDDFVYEKDEETNTIIIK